MVLTVRSHARRSVQRCDGVRPVCGQCVHMEREYVSHTPPTGVVPLTVMAITTRQDCEYTDGPMPSPTQLLERDVARLEARIRELEADPQRMQSECGRGYDRALLSRSH